MPSCKTRFGSTYTKTNTLGVISPPNGYVSTIIADQPLALLSLGRNQRLGGA